MLIIIFILLLILLILAAINIIPLLTSKSDIKTGGVFDGTTFGPDDILYDHYPSASYVVFGETSKNKQGTINKQEIEYLKQLEDPGSRPVGWEKRNYDKFIATVDENKLKEIRKEADKRSNYDRLRGIQKTGYFLDILKEYKEKNLLGAEMIKDSQVEGDNTDVNNTDVNNTDVNNTDVNNTDVNNTDVNNKLLCQDIYK